MAFTALTRRHLIALTGGAVSGTFAGCLGDTFENDGDPSPPSTIADHSSPDLEKWVDAVPRPQTIDPTGTKNGDPYYEITAREIEQKVHRDLAPTTLFAYEGRYPGPTIEAREGEPIVVRWQSELPDEHLLPVDTTVHADEVPYDTTGVRTVTHLHGGNIEAASDGSAQAWFTRDFETTGPNFEKKDYFYVNDQPPGTLWYHDHSLGTTRLNVYAGLAGFYLLRNEQELDLALPDGRHEIPLLLQDRSFNDDGSLFYPTAPSAEEGEELGSAPDPSIVPEFFGDTSVVNGKAWPRLTVEPRPYRFRLLNGANSRFYNLKLLAHDEETAETGSDGPPFVLIGNDAGLLSEPLNIDDRLELGPSQRADVVVDFSECAGETLLLHNNAPAPYRTPVEGTADDGIQSLPQVMLVDVNDAGGERVVGRLPAELMDVPSITLEEVDHKRYLTLTKQSDDYGRHLHLLGTAYDEPHKLTDPVTEEPTLGTTEMWSVANHTEMAHPIHTHLVHSQVLGRQPVGEYDPDEDEIEPDALEAPAPWEQGWNDVVTVHSRDVVHLIMHFGEYEGKFNDQTGEYMWHCHMLEHEDHEMMRPFRVVSESEDAATDN